MTLLNTKNLCFHTNQKLLCRDLNLSIEPGDIWGILGPNGCGKTTLLHVLANLHPHTQGEIFLKNKPLKEYTPKKISQQIGILFQENGGDFSQTVFEFCLTGRHPHTGAFNHNNLAHKNIAMTALALMELQDKLTQQVATLSGGERRRLAVATLLTQTPDIYLLDEPTNHLDIYHQIKTLTHFKQLAANGASIMMALHDVNTAENYCNKVLMLFAEGEYLAGTPRDILSEANLLRLYRHPLQISSRRIWLPLSH